ncbi:uncharacterized protein LOC105423777 [Pogonomyrmex barbatus]|uniref:Uncharacterized protein LOC105423777 n=1 Tax=Pogonomyrmex barbatus TaxID=144034 RepID=A0A6I9WJT0_9HYME|nr:uncharacterized protein LOC105423777 [Pogonomyrmex barbatus]
MMRCHPLEELTSSPLRNVTAYSPVNVIDYFLRRHYTLTSNNLKRRSLRFPLQFWISPKILLKACVYHHYREIAYNLLIEVLYAKDKPIDIIRQQQYMINFHENDCYNVFNDDDDDDDDELFSCNHRKYYRKCGTVSSAAYEKEKKRRERLGIN